MVVVNSTFDENAEKNGMKFFYNKEWCECGYVKNVSFENNEYLIEISKMIYDNPVLRIKSLNKKDKFSRWCVKDINDYENYTWENVMIDVYDMIQK